jgi:hypothetical protein
MTENNNQYYSVANMKKIMVVFQKFLTDKYNIDHTQLQINLKQEIFSIMEKLKQNPLHINMNTSELNKITLHTLKDIFKNNQVANNQSKLLNNQNISTRDNLLYTNRKNNYQDNTNINQATLNKNLTPVIEEFDKITEERKFSTNTQENQIITDDIVDQQISQEDFEKQLNYLQSYRDKFIEDTLNENPNQRNNTMEFPATAQSITQQPIIQSIAQPIDNLKSRLMQSTSDLMQDRNSLNTSQFQGIQDMDPKQIYAQSEAIKDIETNLIINKPVTDIQPSYPLIKRDNIHLKEVINEKYVAINSFDRNWIDQPNRYQYQVKFNYVHRTSQKIPIYPNNPTIPNTKSAVSPGIPNRNGYYDDSNVFHPAYDSTVGLGGDPIAYEYIEVLVDDNTNVQTNFKDIYSIEISKVIIPVDINNALPGRLYNFNLSDPYLLLQIDEFKDVYEGTDNAIRNSFCQLVYESTYQGSNGRGYMVLKPVQNEKKIFQPNLLSSMPSITLSIKSPNGLLLNDSIDGYSILKVDYEPFNKFYLKIITNTYFDSNEFFSGDKVIIKRYNAYKISTDQNTTNIANLNSFINRDEGHEITKLGDASDNSFFKTYYIKAPGTFDNIAGTYTLDNAVLNDLVLFNCEYDISANPINGFVLNMSLQNSITMKIVTKTQESSLLKHELI